MGLAMFFVVFLRCLEPLSIWFPLDIVHVPMEAHKVGKQTWSPGNAADTLSSWWVWECCDHDFQICNTRDGTRLLGKFLVQANTFILCPEDIPGIPKGCLQPRLSAIVKMVHGLVFHRVMTSLGVIIEPSSSNLWKQMQRSIAKHWAELPVSGWRGVGKIVWEIISRT